MTPDDLSVVQASWSAFVREREAVLAALAESFRDVESTSVAAAHRASWLYRAVEELVELLPQPSRLEIHARHLGDTWPDPLIAPSYAVDGRAWMHAGAACLRTWSSTTEAAWREAWRLLSDVLAAETLSPFSDGA